MRATSGTMPLEPVRQEADGNLGHVLPLLHGVVDQALEVAHRPLHVGRAQPAPHTRPVVLSRCPTTIAPAGRRPAGTTRARLARAAEQWH